jgi:hypothetical protein
MRPPRPGPAASFIVSVIIVTLLRIPSAYRVSQENVGQRTVAIASRISFISERACIEDDGSLRGNEASCLGA